MMSNQQINTDFEGIEGIGTQPELGGCQKSVVMILTIMLSFVAVSAIIAFVSTNVDDARQISNSAYGALGFFMIGVIAVINRTLKAIMMRFSGKQK